MITHPAASRPPLPSAGFRSGLSWNHALALLPLLFLASCAMPPMKVRDTLPPGTSKGWAEFSLNPDSDPSALAVRRRGDRDLSIHAVGTFGGNSNCSLALRIAAAPGTAVFFTGWHTLVLSPDQAGMEETAIEIPIKEGWVTPVRLTAKKVDSTPLITANSIGETVTLNIEASIQPPVPFTPVP